MIDLKGIGFGDQKTRNPLQKGLNWIGHLVSFLNHKDKKDIFLLTRKTIKLCKLAGFSVSFDVFKQILSLHLIIKHMSTPMINKKRLIFLVIGDGYGFMASLIKECFPNALVILVDLGKVLLFQTYYLQKIYSKYAHVLFDDISTNNITECDFLYCPADKLNNLSKGLHGQKLKIDTSINIASMQEMTLESIQKYFDFLRENSSKENLFYCCNREKKTLIGGEVLEIRKYPWCDLDHIYIDEYCPWYRFFFTVYPFLGKNKPQLMGVSIPFVNYFDGPFIHRLAKLETSF